MKKKNKIIPERDLAPNDTLKIGSGGSPAEREMKNISSPKDNADLGSGGSPAERAVKNISSPKDNADLGSGGSPAERAVKNISSPKDNADLGSGGSPGTPVRVSIKSQTIDLLKDDAPAPEDAGVIEYSTDGRLVLEGGWVRITYDEPTGLGMDDSTTSLIFDRDKPEFINMARSGGVTAGLTFDAEVPRQNCAVNAGVAGLEFCVCTRSVKNCVTPENGGKIELDYLIEFRGVKTERNIFRMKVTPAPESGARP